MSSKMTKSGDALGAIASYYKNTSEVVGLLENMFAAVFPESYPKYKVAFEAGRWLGQDPGPWLGRAIVYKLDGALHTDRKDFGPAACVPCGHFTGGQMLVPQFKGKFT